MLCAGTKLLTEEVGMASIQAFTWQADKLVQDQGRQSGAPVWGPHIRRRQEGLGFVWMTRLVPGNSFIRFRMRIGVISDGLDNSRLSIRRGMKMEKWIISSVVAM
jgi:hypothetical protein